MKTTKPTASLKAIVKAAVDRAVEIPLKTAVDRAVRLYLEGFSKIVNRLTENHRVLNENMFNTIDKITKLVRSYQDRIDNLEQRLTALEGRLEALAC